MLQLKYKLWHLKDGSKRYGIPLAPRRGFSVLSLHAPDIYGNEREIAVYDSCDSPAWIEQEISALPIDQQYAIKRLLSGQRITYKNKALTAARKRFRFIIENQPNEQEDKNGENTL